MWNGGQEERKYALCIVTFLCCHLKLNLGLCQAPDSLDRLQFVSWSSQLIHIARPTRSNSRAKQPHYCNNLFVSSHSLSGPDFSGKDNSFLSLKVLFISFLITPTPLFSLWNVYFLQSLSLKPGQNSSSTSPHHSIAQSIIAEVQCFPLSLVWYVYVKLSSQAAYTELFQINSFTHTSTTFLNCVHPKSPVCHTILLQHPSQPLPTLMY